MMERKREAGRKSQAPRSPRSDGRLTRATEAQGWATAETPCLAAGRRSPRKAPSDPGRHLQTRRGGCAQSIPRKASKGFSWERERAREGQNTAELLPQALQQRHCQVGNGESQAVKGWHPSQVSPLSVGGVATELPSQPLTALPRPPVSETAMPREDRAGTDRQRHGPGRAWLLGQTTRPFGPAGCPQSGRPKA